MQPIQVDSNFQSRALTEQRKTNMTYPNTATTEVAKMRLTGRITENQQAERLDSIVDDAVQETLHQEEEMKRRESQDDHDLNALKQKLKMLEQTPAPQNKDQMIDYLAKRLQSAEDAIKMCEEIIRHERSNRKEMSQDLKERNQTLREILEQEKRSLKDKVDDQLEATLQMAVRERMQATEQLGVVQKQFKAIETEKSELQARASSLDEQSSA